MFVTHIKSESYKYIFIYFTDYHMTNVLLICLVARLQLCLGSACAAVLRLLVGHNRKQTIRLENGKMVLDHKMHTNSGF